MPSESTLKQYAMRMEILKKNGINPTENPQSFLDWAEKNEHGGSSQKLYLSAIKNSNPAAFPKVLQDRLSELYGRQNEKDKDQKLSEKQEKNYVPWKELAEVQTRLAGMEKTSAMWKQFLVVSLYTLNAPVRADYGEMEVHSKRDKKRTENELIWNSKPVFVFRKYKTAKTYGVVEIPVSAPLRKVIAGWFEHLGNVPQYLLGGSSSSSNTFAVYVADTFKKYTDKEVGVSLLRHSYITEHFPKLNTIKQKEDLARRMLHSKDLQEKYRIV
jgi:hypothetical protein